MSLEFAANLAVTAAKELVSTRKELRNVEDRYEKLYNEHENLKESMLVMEKKLIQLEKTVACQNEQVTRLKEAEKEWSTEHILRETEAELAKASPDTNKIKQLNAKYEVAYKFSKLKNSFLLNNRS